MTLQLRFLQSFLGICLWLRLFGNYLSGGYCDKAERSTNLQALKHKASYNHNTCTWKV